MMPATTFMNLAAKAPASALLKRKDMSYKNSGFANEKRINKY